MEVNEAAIFFGVMNVKGVIDSKAGIRLNNIKFYCINFDEDNNSLYLKSTYGVASLTVTGSALDIGIQGKPFLY